MNKFKLNFSRFEGEDVHVGNLVVGSRLDINGLDANAKKAESVYTKVADKAIKAAEAQDTLSKSVANTRKSFESIKEDSVRAFNRNLDVLREASGLSGTSAKSKGKITSFLGKTKSAGLDNLRIKDARSLSNAQANRVLTLNRQASNLVGSTMGELPRASARESFSLQKGGSPLGGNLSFGNTASIDKSATALDKLRNSLSKVDTASQKAKSNFKGFIQELKSVAVTWRILSGFFKGIINTFASLYDSAASYEEALNLYRTSFGEYAEAADKWAERISSALYLDPKDVMQYAGAFYNLTSGLGVSSDAAYTMATNLTQLSYDMSSFLNIDVASAQAKVQSAMTGQSRAVASAGVAMQQATLQELAYSIGLNKTVSEMTQAEKTYLRYIQLMRSTANMQMDLGKTIISPENALRVVKAQFIQLGRAIGQIFIPIVMTAIPYIMLLTQALQRLATWLGKKLGYEIAPIDYSKFKKASTYVNDLGDDADNTTKKLGNIGKAADNVSRSLAPFDELNVVESEGSSTSPGSAGGGGYGGSGSDFDFTPFLDSYDMLKRLTGDFDAKLDEAREKIKKILPIVEAIGGAFLAWKLSKKFVEDYLKVNEFMEKAKPLKEVISSPAAQNVATVAGLALAIYENFKSVNDETERFKEAWESGDIAEYFKIDSLDELMDKIRLFTFILQGGLPAALAVAGAKLGWFDDLVKKLKESFGKAKDFIVDKVSEIGEKLKEHFGDRFQKIYNEQIKPTIANLKELWEYSIKPVFDNAKDKFDEVKEKIKEFVEKHEWLKEVISKVATVIKDTFIHVMEAPFVAALGVAIAKIESVIDWIESVAKTVKNVTDAIKKFGDGDWKGAFISLKDAVVNAFKGMVSLVAGPFKKLIEAVQKAINAGIRGVRSFIDKINNIKIDLPGGGSVGFNIPKPSEITIDTSELDRLKTGIDFVPKDYYGPVFLDYGERVLTQAENKQYMKGNAAYLNNLSNSSATANNKQLATEIANALLDSMRLAEANRQPDITQVYIGNDKVYEGYGVHQNREADRYGTTYVKV